MISSRKKLTALLMSLLLLVLAGCSTTKAPAEAPKDQKAAEAPKDSKPADAPQKGGSLTIGMMMTGLPTSDPQKARTISDMTIARLVAEPLVMWEDGKYVGVLAEKFDVSPDGLVYTFFLRKGVKYHNGKPVDAESIKQNFARITNKEKPLYAAGTLSQVASVDVVDASTVKITLKAVNPEFPMNLANVWMIEPQAAKEMGDGFDKAPVGVGPFKVKTFVPDQQIVLERNPEYWGGEALLDSIMIKPIPDADTLVMELRSGTVDMITFLPMKDVVALKEANFQMLPFVRVNLAYVTFNNKTLSDVRLRKAIAYALDRSAILKTAYNGQGKLTKHIALEGTYAFNNQVKGYDFNPNEAKKILDEAGWKDTNNDGIREKDGQKMKFEIATNNGNKLREQSAVIIQQALKKLGIEVTINLMEWNAFLDHVDSDKKQAYILGWSLGFDPDAHSIFHTEGGFNMMHGYSNKTVDELIEKGRVTTDLNERKKIYGEMQQILSEEQVYTWLYFANTNMGLNTRIKGAKNGSPNGLMWNFEEWWIADSKAAN